MKRASFTLLAFIVVATTFGKEPAPTVTFVSPCECIAFHGINRWVAKTDLSPVPSDMTDYTEARLPAEEKWYALTGRVVDAKVEADGDIHLALQDADGNNRYVVAHL
jgi:hypothetical protein